jgi:hypothetical protein
MGERPVSRVRGPIVLAAILAAAAVAGGTAGQAAQTGEAPGAVAAQSLGTVTLDRNVYADGKQLRSGRYEVRLMPDARHPASEDAGEAPDGWVEFVRGDRVAGRQPVTIVPQAEILLVAKDQPPKPGGATVRSLEGDEYLRVWIFRGGLHYLIHLPTSPDAP